MIIPDKVYHCTKRRLLPKILKEGINPRYPMNRIIEGRVHGIFVEEKVMAVFVSSTPFKWMFWVQQPMFQGDINEAAAMITIDPRGLKIIEDPINTVDGVKDGDDYAVLETIPPSRFMEIVVSDKKTPDSFYVLEGWAKVFGNTNQGKEKNHEHP